MASERLKEFLQWLSEQLLEPDAFKTKIQEIKDSFFQPKEVELAEILEGFRERIFITNQKVWDERKKETASQDQLKIIDKEEMDSYSLKLNKSNVLNISRQVKCRTESVKRKKIQQENAEVYDKCEQCDEIGIKTLKKRLTKNLRNWIHFQKKIPSVQGGSFTFVELEKHLVIRLPEIEISFRKKFKDLIFKILEQNDRIGIFSKYVQERGRIHLVGRPVLCKLPFRVINRAFIISRKVNVFTPKSIKRAIGNRQVYETEEDNMVAVKHVLITGAKYITRYMKKTNLVIQGKEVLTAEKHNMLLSEEQEIGTFIHEDTVEIKDYPFDRGRMVQIAMEADRRNKEYLNRILTIWSQIPQKMSQKGAIDFIATRLITLLPTLDSGGPEEDPRLRLKNIAIRKKLNDKLIGTQLKILEEITGEPEIIARQSRNMQRADSAGSRRGEMMMEEG